MDTFQAQYDGYRRAAEDFLAGLFPGGASYGRLQEAMRYSLLAGGKRIRPVLTLAFCELLGGDRRNAVPVGCAVELVHTYSLIHDDLPCMDNDDLRRGQPTCHRAYGETLAVLAGDALQAEAFRLIASAEGLTAGQRSEGVLTLALACGGGGMVAGQVLDMDQIVPDEGALRTMCALKTGAMIRAAAELGCIAAGAGAGERQKAAAYGEHIGLAFQVRDDILDVSSSEEELGKPIGSDREMGKRTFVDFLGLEGSEALVARETALAKEAVSELAGNGFLLALADSLADRRS